MHTSNPPITLFALYQSLKGQGGNREHAHALLTQAHWFASNADFDPKTGDALPQPLNSFLARLARPAPAAPLHDRVWRITEHARPAVERLLRTLNESPRRKHALLPVRSVRELDASSFIKLSNRPGRNIREKLAGKPYLEAVRRFQSVNLPENRLLKAFVIRLAELLELRRDHLGEQEDELLPRLQSWLLSDEAKAVGRWEYLPPTNTLLSHRDYRCIWGAWRWMETLDDDIVRDFAQLDAREETMRQWMDYGHMYREETHQFADMPVLFDHDKFMIRTWSPTLIFRRAARKIGRSTQKRTIAQAACLDLTEVCPRFASTAGGFQALTDTYLWQQWKGDADTVDIALFTSDAAYLHPDASTITFQDLFFASDRLADHLLERAARAFSGRLRDTFKDDRLIWLVPDALNDFDLQIVRRNLNARFPGAEPLPRSVAAVFEKVDYTRITNDGYPVVVVDAVGGVTCATRMIARFDADLKTHLPETKGYYWERCPPVMLSKHDTGEDRRYGIVAVDSNGEWHNIPPPEGPQFIERTVLKANTRIGHFARCINLSNSPVVGGMRLHALQARAGDMPLWRDQIPELAIKGYIDGFYRRFYLVSRGRTIEPIRGRARHIPITERFMLYAGKRSYEFPLFQGENAAELRFSARLDSPSFPLKVNTKCDLILTFQYGDDEPYTLLFHPVDGSFPDVRARWEPTTQGTKTDALAPEYPNPKLWAELYRFPDTQRGGTIDLIQEAASTSSNLNRWLNSTYDDAHEKLQKNIRGWCRFLFFSVWRDGRSIADTDCPAGFVTATHSLLNTLQDATEHGVSDFDVMVLMSSMHKDMPDECIQWIYEQVESGRLRSARSVGFALGDMSQKWQQYVYDRLASHPDTTINVFAYAIWRERHFVERISLSELLVLINALSKRLANIRPVRTGNARKYDEGAIRKWARATAEPLELLLGLLRTRTSNDPDIRMLLQPHQKMAKLFAEQIDRLEEMIAETHVTLFSRVQINIQKPEGVRSPDLLYALRLYLTGDDGANAIHITGISDTDDD